MNTADSVSVSDDKHASFEKTSSIGSISKTDHEAEKQETHFKATLDPVDEVDAVGKWL